MLGPTAGAESAFLFGHLELWTSEIIPFILSAPFLLLLGRPNRDELMEDIEKIRSAAAKHTERGDVAIKEEEVKFYEKQVFGTVAFGLFGGAFAGIIIALLESFWLQRTLTELSDSGMYLWGTVVYSIIFAGVGVGVCGALLFLYLLFNRFLPYAINFALCFGGTFAAGGLIIGMFRYKRDVLQSHGFTMPDLIKLFLLIGGTTLVLIVIGAVVFGLMKAITKASPVKMIAGGLAVYILLIAASGVIGAVQKPEKKQIAFTPPTKAEGPNIILVAIDTLRADYLQAYNPNAVAKTPKLDEFVSDAVLFKYGYAQASWTKPSFASMFTGLYPESHTATTKTAIIPDDVQTLAEVLRDGGYYTKGFANNPNVSSVFNFHQGFTDYTYLDPSLYFYASSSAEKMSMYQVLRKVYQSIADRLHLDMIVFDFYQPAETVTQLTLDWVDSGAVPEGNPFYLYLHYMDPHDPYMDPEAPAGGYARVRLNDPDPEAMMQKDNTDIIGDMKRAYNREIEHLDKYLGELFEGLKQRGIYEDSLILIVADHGEEFFDHNSWWHGRTLYEEQCRIPYIMKLPGNREAGTENTDYARHVDIAPTFLHFAGLSPAPGMPDKPLYDKDGSVFTNALISYVYSENDFEGNILKAVHDKNKMKLITANEDNPRGLETVELYNLIDVYLEQENLAEDPTQAETKAQLEGVIEEFQEVIKNNAAEPQSIDSVSPELQDQLGGLGYLE
jgi:arylsulfatase